jgi:hypothetical protein
MDALIADQAEVRWVGESLRIAIAIRWANDSLLSLAGQPGWLISAHCNAWREALHQNFFAGSSGFAESLRQSASQIDSSGACEIQQLPHFCLA